MYCILQPLSPRCFLLEIRQKLARRESISLEGKSTVSPLQGWSLAVQLIMFHSRISVNHCFPSAMQSVKEKWCQNGCNLANCVFCVQSRAVYAQADVYLLDDPLSAVDAHVGAHLFESCICGMLKNSTRILVTHQQQFLPEAGRIAVFNNGTIEHLGTYDELLEQGVNFQEFAFAVEEKREAPGAPYIDT